MPWTPLRQRLDRLPLILVGPMLRRTEPESVTVWVALRQPCTITLEVFSTQAGAVIQHRLLQGCRATVALGQALHLAAVTARPIAGEALQPGQIYAYRLSFAIDGATPPVQYSLQQALTSELMPQATVSYFEHQLPTFTLPAAHPDHLHILHGSCRKPHGGGHDALPILDDLLAETCCQPDRRPQQLFLTGDQIYGDDVADALLFQLTDAGNTLLGWDEQLPLGLTFNDIFAQVAASQLKPGERSLITDRYGGFTAGIHDQSHRTKSHLLSWAEYCAAYLFAWSPVVWSKVFPDRQQVQGSAEPSRQWQYEIEMLGDFLHTLWKVRRVMANLPTYSIFDDHDISDDWYLNRAWCLRVLGKPLGRRVVQNGLLAYALFQAWGNTPDQFEPEQPGERLLAATARWTATAGQDLGAAASLSRLLGLPLPDPQTGLPQFQLDRDAWVLKRHPQALCWHYTIRGSCHEVIVIDSRTWRAYPPPQDDQPQSDTAPPKLISASQFDRQIRQPLQQTEAEQLISLVVAPTNLINLEAIDYIQHQSLQQGKIFHHDVGDAWNMDKSAFADLLAALFAHRTRIIVLSGDIHYGFAARLGYGSQTVSPVRAQPWHVSELPCQLVQFTASAFKNSEWKTLLIQTRLKSLFPERSQLWLGWNSAPKPEVWQAIAQTAQTVSAASDGRWICRIPDTPRQFEAICASSWPDWYYRIAWVLREPAQAADWAHSSRWLPPVRVGWRQRFITGFKLLWNNRWFQEGKEVVGRSNVGHIHFADMASAQAEVRQSLYWYAPWDAARVVSSQFRAALPPKAPRQDE